VADFHYPQFCAIARAAEIVGERWTILIVRELFLGPQRFSDLRRRLSDVSPSVLTERLTALEQRGLVTKADLPPPAASVVYELTETGRGLGPVLMALAQWGSQFLLPIRPGEQLDPDRLRYGLGLYARRSGASEQCIEFRIRRDHQLVTLHARGGPDGTGLFDSTTDQATVVIEGEALDIVGVALGTAEGRAALREGRVRVLKGPRSATRIREIMAELFEFDSVAGPAGRAFPSTPNHQRRRR
jgi:DNA-binding HxlR family transcriptional regulator